MKYALFLTLCLSLLLDVCAKGRGGGGGRSGSKSSTSLYKKSSGSSSSSSTKGTSSSSGSNTGSKSKSTHQSSHQRPIKDISGLGWMSQYPTHDKDSRQPNMAGNTYPYWNPNNKIMSPHYAGNYAYGAHGRSYGQGGSPFAQSVQSMGYSTSSRSKSFGNQAVVAAGTGAVAGMALGYGLGSYPRPHFHFHDPQQERYYNQYMYQHYGSQESRNTNKHTQTYGQSSPGDKGNQGSSDGSSSSRSGGSSDDNRPLVLLNPPPQSFDYYMNTCMKRNDLLPSEPTKNQSQAQNKTVVGAPSPTQSTKPSQEVKKEGGQENETKDKGAERKDDNENLIANLLEIDYPALIEQLKACKCVELYAVYTQYIAEKQWQEAYGHGAKPTAMGFFSSSLLCLIGFLLLY